MQHPNARLTPRGRLELVLLVERGASLRRQRARATSRFRPRIAGSCAGALRRRASGPRWCVCSTVRAGRIAVRGCSRRTSSSGSSRRARRPAGGRGCSPARSGSPTRRSGKCCAATAARGRRGRSGSRRIGMSGRARATCCTWTSRRYARFERPGHARDRRCAHRTIAPRSERASATTSPTRSSTTTRAWPTSSCSPTSAPRPSPASSSAASRTSPATASPHRG